MAGNKISAGLAALKVMSGGVSTQCMGFHLVL